MERKTKPKKCKVCAREFYPARQMQKVCGWQCGLSIARKTTEKDEAKRKKEERKQDRKKLDELRPLSWFHAKTTKAVHEYIRLRDKNEPCISCGAMSAAQWDAGHLISRGSNPTLRYEYLNIHKQCSVCNQHLSGNLIRYQDNLIKKIGKEAVDWLKGPHKPRKWTREDLEAIEKDAKERIAMLKSIEKCN